MPRVSVLVQSYNKPAMLAEAIDSVLDQTYQDFEILLLDDNSASGVRDVIFRHWYCPQLVVVKSNVTPQDRPKTCRYATMANIGLKIARGEYVTYLCDDDLYLPRRLELMVDRLDEGDCQVVYGAQEIRQDGLKLGVRPAEDVLTDAYHRVDHSSVMHTRAVALEVGGWDDDPRYWNWADAIFWRRLNAAGYAFYPIPEVLDVHRNHRDSVSSRLSQGLAPCG